MKSEILDIFTKNINELDIDKLKKILELLDKMEIKQIERISQILSESNLNEINYKSFLGSKFHLIKKNTEYIVHSTPEHTVTNIPVAQVKNASTNDTKSTTESVSNATKEPTSKVYDEKYYRKITSPIVGTFYKAPSPNSPAYVEVGKKIKKGDVVCILEAMKVMNEIESEYSGEIVEICVENGQPVEYGQTLFWLKLDI